MPQHTLSDHRINHIQSELEKEGSIGCHLLLVSLSFKGIAG